MRVLVVGTGGREHALCAAFKRSTRVSEVYCASGNAGIADIATLVPIGPNEVTRLADHAEKNAIDLTFVGGETPLALGIADEFEARGLKIVGPSRAAARLESSKAFAKDFMARHGVPTALYKTAGSAAEASDLLRSGIFGDEYASVVVKADGLAAGKGVVVAEDRVTALGAIDEMSGRVGPAAAEKIVLEECIFGPEMSLIMFADGESFSLMPPTRDHKRIGEQDTGPNTGGMGAVTDDSFLTPAQTQHIIEQIIEPTFRGCRDEGFPFRGILFLGLMMTTDGPKLLEYNVRFGDPETQAILVRLETDMADICDAIVSGTLAAQEIEWRKGSSACVVLASRGYPEDPQTGDVISGAERAATAKDVTIFHAGTSRNANGELITSGGRVLGVTAVGSDIPEALEKAYGAVDEISWDGMQFRRDIGKRLL